MSRLASCFSFHRLIKCLICFPFLYIGNITTHILIYNVKEHLSEDVTLMDSSNDVFCFATSISCQPDGFQLGENDENVLLAIFLISLFPCLIYAIWFVVNSCFTSHLMQLLLFYVYCCRACYSITNTCLLALTTVVLNHLIIY